MRSDFTVLAAGCQSSIDQDLIGDRYYAHISNIHDNVLLCLLLCTMYSKKSVKGV